MEHGSLPGCVCRCATLLAGMRGDSRRALERMLQHNVIAPGRALSSRNRSSARRGVAATSRGDGDRCVSRVSTLERTRLSSLETQSSLSVGALSPEWVPRHMTCLV